MTNLTLLHRLFAVAGGLLTLAAPIRAEDRTSRSDLGLRMFRQDIQPLLAAKCLGCHGPDKKRGGLDLSRRASLLSGGESGPGLVSGNASASLLLRKLSDREMPPENPLTPEQVAAFKSWIDGGAPYENEPLVSSLRRASKDWWSLRPIVRPPLPAVRQHEWARTPIDVFILAKLDEKELQPAQAADRRTLIRRLSFDLLGLPPAPAEIDEFVRDLAPDAWERLVDRMLASPHYGERWGRHWLDVVRFAESHGYETNNLRLNAWPYRDYVIRAFNDDIPYPRFILEQLAGDRMGGGDWLTQSATGFLVGGAHDVVGNQTPEGAAQQRMDDLDDMVATVGATFLGLTVNCARCHDHKFDPIPQRDYYRLQANLAGVQHNERELVPPNAADRELELARLTADLAHLDLRIDELEPLASSQGKHARRAPVDARRNVERFSPHPARFVRFTVLATNSLEPCLDELEIYGADVEIGNVALATRGAKATASSVYPNSEIHRLEHINDGKHGNGRSWISNEPGAGWVQIELPKVMLIDRIVWGRDREEKFRDRLATSYRIEAAAEPGNWEVIASSEDRRSPGSPTTEPMDPALSHLQRQRSTVRERIDQLRASSKVYAGTFAQPPRTHVLERGDPLRQADPVVPGGLSVLRPNLELDADRPEAERRLALAQWIGQADNPLPARVMVNRLWHYHFGQGIVPTPSDFGFNGGRPSHPELLDWLADEFQGTSWSIKKLHRLILLSATYQQSGVLNDQALTVDRENTLLWRMSPRRLEAEPLRDALLQVSGQLDRRMGGPGYNIWEKNTNYVVVFKPKLDLGPDEYRRMVYQFKPRSQPDPTFGTFDCPDAALARPRRTVSTTALQALNLLNGSFVLDRAHHFAQRLREEAGDSELAQIERGFLLAFGRRPRESESRAASQLVRAQGLAALCRALCNASEFLYVD